MRKDHKPQSERNWYSALPRLSAISKAFVPASPISETAPLVSISDLRKRGVELHLAALVPARSGPESGDSPLDPAAALLHQ